jgi:hypothetical protein
MPLIVANDVGLLLLYETLRLTVLTRASGN